MKLGAAIPVLNEWRFVPAVVGQLLRVVERIVILRPTRSQSGAKVDLTPLPDLDPRVEVLMGNWHTEPATRNAGMDYLNACDYVFMVDSDEILLDRDLEELGRLCQTAEHQVIGVPWYCYWKTPAYRIDPPHPGVIRMVVHRDVRFQGTREVNCRLFYRADVRCRHLAYVRTDREVREKHRLAAYAMNVTPDWYQGVWKRWDRKPDLENLHPVEPEKYKRAVHEPDPELGQVLERWGCA